MKITQFKDIPEFTRFPSYRIHTDWKYLENQLDVFRERGELQLDPDFQRGHVWTQEKQIAYVIFALRGGKSGRQIIFNQAGWNLNGHGPVVLIDGKQRLEAVRAFMNNEFPVYGSFYREFTDSLRIRDAYFEVCVNDLETRAEVLQFYIDFNSGGVVHTDEELQKVCELLDYELR